MDEGDLRQYSFPQQDASRKSLGQNGGAADVPSRSPTTLRDSLPQMMFGFGDEENPLPETVECMEQLVGEYVRHLTDEACKAADVKGLLDTECFEFALRKDRDKWKRVKEVLEIHKHVKHSTRMRFTEAEPMVFQPSFPPQPRKRTLASLSLISAPDPRDTTPSAPSVDENGT